MSTSNADWLVTRASQGFGWRLARGVAAMALIALALVLIPFAALGRR